MTTEKLSFEEFASSCSGAKHLIGRVSFEERSLSIANALANKNLSTFLAFISKERGVSAQSNANKLTAPDQVFARDVVLGELDVADPLHVARELSGRLNEEYARSQLNDTIIDVTSFRREELLMVLAILRDLEIEAPPTCHLVYVGAAKMGQWMSGQVTSHRSVIGYAGKIWPSRPTKLVVLMGFESNRAVSIIENYEPSMLLLGHGRPSESITPELSSLNEGFFRDLQSQYENLGSAFEFSARDPLKVADELEAAIKPSSEFNVIVAPLHTKLSTLGVGIYARRHPETQVCYAPVAEYNEESYSKPGNDVYVTPLAALLE